MRCYVGVDYKLREVSLAVQVIQDEGAVSTFAATKVVQNGLPLANTLCTLAGRTEALIHHVFLLAKVHVDDVVICVVESPGAHPHRPHPNLIMAQGAIMAKLVDMGMAVVPAPVTEWKAETVGKSHATKEEVQAYVQKYLNFHGTEDESDAAAMADYAARVSSR